MCRTLALLCRADGGGMTPARLVPSPYLACPLVGSHLQTDGGVVSRGQHWTFGVIQMPPGAVRVHTCLAGTLVGPHLQRANTKILN